MKDTRKKKFLHFACRNVGRRSSSICGVEIWSYTKRGYNLVDQFLNIRSIFQNVCNVMMYAAMI
jgi:hypothetical protein